MNIITINLNIRDSENYALSIQSIIKMHQTEVEPFSIIAIYQTNEDKTVPVSLAHQLACSMRIIVATKKSSWDKRIVLVNAPVQSHWLSRLVHKMFLPDIEAHIAGDGDEARKLLE